VDAADKTGSILVSGSIDSMDAWVEGSLLTGLTVCALTQAVLMLIHAGEHRRFHAARARAPLPAGSSLPARVFVPCKGCETDLEANLAALFQQDYPDYELCFVVESVDDPAVPLIERLRRENPRIPSTLVVAGLAEGCGQKVHNLQKATAQLPDETRVLAFVDSDARPNPSFLRRLVDRLESGKHAIATGYRWHLPARRTVVNLLHASANNWLSTLTSSHSLNLVWGGAWAIRRETFDRLDLPWAWNGALSDDLVLSRHLRDAGLRVAYEPHCLVASPLETSWAGTFEFLRRQYLVTRVCAPVWWTWGVLAACLSLSIPALSLVLTGRLLQTGGYWQVALGVGVTHYLVTACRLGVGMSAVGGFIPRERDAARSIEPVCRLIVWAWPVITLIHLVGLGLSSVGRTLKWRGIRYRLVGPQQTTILSRPATPASTAGISVPAPHWQSVPGAVRGAR
jgi:ceramide glucosyltransferase